MKPDGHEYCFVSSGTVLVNGDLLHHQYMAAIVCYLYSLQEPFLESRLVAFIGGWDSGIASLGPFPTIVCSIFVQPQWRE